MESANLHHHHQHHQLQDQLVIGSSPPPTTSTTSSRYGAAVSHHAWTQSTTLNTAASHFNPDFNGILLNSRQKNETVVPSMNSNSMVQDLGSFYWNTNAGNQSFTIQSAADHHDLQLSKIKRELSSSSSSSESLPKFSDLLNSPSSSSIENDPQKDLNDLRERLLLKTISSGFPINGQSIYSSNSVPNFCSIGSLMPSRGNFSQIYPSINISNLNQSPPSISSSFGMNLQSLDLLASSKFSGAAQAQPPLDHNLGIYKDCHSLGIDHCMQQSRVHKPSSCSPSKATSYANEIAEAKKPKTLQDQPNKAAVQAPAPKKSRVDSRATCPPPFKVRKEKLGDRIAALQQLVAPFGKTDTASVLMEAIGYIKFLQNQVETLSVPYMKSSRNKNSSTRGMQGGVCSTADGNNEEPRKDLRSRGLCLVPLSCLSYVTSVDCGGVGGGIWPPPPSNFGGGT